MWPFKDNTFDVLRAYDAIEHIKNPIHLMNEIWRVCRVGAVVHIFVPSTDGRGAFQDPTHVSFWNINSFQYYIINSPVLYKLGRSYGFNGVFVIKNFNDIQDVKCEQFEISGIIYTRVKMYVLK